MFLLGPTFPQLLKLLSVGHSAPYTRIDSRAESSIVLKHQAAWSFSIALIIILGCTGSEGSTAVGKSTEVNRSKGAQTAGESKHSCGYPNNIRDGLAPAQYFRMAEVLLGDYDLISAKQCLQKLRSNKASSEAQIYADLLEKTAMPSEPVPEVDLKLLKEAEKLEKHGDFEQAKAIYQTLIRKFPRFEWAYMQLANHYAYYRRDQKKAEELLEESLKLNPNNIDTLQACITLANNMQQHEKAYEYCLRLRAVDPTYSSYHLDWELDNHDRTASLRNMVHRAAPRVTAVAPQSVPQPAPQTAPASIRATNRATAETVIATMRSTMLAAMKQTAERDEKYPPQMINEKGEIQIAFGPNVDAHGTFCSNLLPVLSDHRTQYWNEQGKQAFSRSFDDGKDFSEGLAAAKDGKWGFIDSTGQFVIANNFDYATSFSDGLAAVSIGGSWGFVNKKGEVVIEPVYEEVKPFSNGLALVKLRNKIGYLDKNGQLAIVAKFDSGRSFSDGLAEVGFLDNEKHELRLCYIDTAGKVCIDTSKIEVSAEPDAKEQSIYDLDDGKTVFGFKCATGMSSREKLPRDFQCGLAGIKLGKNYGYINKDGKVAIEPVYRVAYDFSENLATVQPSSSFYKAAIDTSGNMVIGPQYREISQFHNGIAAVNQWEQTSMNALWGFIDKKGEPILPLQYFEATPFVGGLARVQPTSMSLAAAKFDAVRQVPLVVALPPDTSLWAQAATRKIAAAWPAEVACDVDQRARFTFKLDQAGNAYDITFIEGCASPKTMLATVHSVLFAMPFEKRDGTVSIVLDLEAQNGSKPKITINCAGSKVEAKVKETEVEKEVEKVEGNAADSEDKILSGMPGKRKSQVGRIVRQWMNEKLLYLCEKSAKYPDSPLVKAELVKIFEAFAINPASAHDWLCIARGNPPELALRQNPDNIDERNCNAPVGAVFQAWKLQKSEDNLYELEGAYRHKLALDLLHSKGDNPLFLGIAAELMDQYATAVKFYSQCPSSSLFAKKLSTRFSSEVPLANLGKLAGSAVNSRDWKAVINWLPIDSEVLIAVLNPQSNTKSGSGSLVSSLFDSLQAMLGAEKGEKSDIQFAIHGGRNFQSPKDIGVGSQAGAEIRIFAKTPPDVSSVPTIEKITALTERLEGFDIVAAEMKYRYSQSTLLFIARPFANVEISATDRHYLRQILSRIKSKPTDRAFPDSLPEWATIDLKSDCWSLRHYDKSCAPFDRSAPMTLVEPDDLETSDGIITDNSCTGFTFCGNKDGTFKVCFLGSNPKTLKALTDGWNHYSEINTGQFWGTGKGPQDYKMSPLKVTFSADKKTATASGKTTEVTAPMLNIILMNQLGWLVAL